MLRSSEAVRVLMGGRAAAGWKPGAVVWLAGSAAAHVVVAAVVWVMWEPSAAKSTRSKPVTLDVSVEKPKAAQKTEPVVAPSETEDSAAESEERRVRSRAVRRTRVPARQEPVEVAPVNPAVTQAASPAAYPAASAVESPAASNPYSDVEPVKTAEVRVAASAVAKRGVRASRVKATRSKKHWASVAGRMRRAIRKHLRYPEAARRQGREGVVVLRFRVRNGGRARPVVVKRSAGAILDRAAVRAVRRAQPLPAYPDWIEIPLKFTLDD